VTVEIFNPRVLIAAYDPRIPTARNKKLSQALGWNSVEHLAHSFIADLREASHGICNYQIAGRVEIDAFPIKEDGFRYATDQYMRAWHSQQGFHAPDWADYHQILRDTKAVDWIRKNRADEIWLFAFPYGGFYESRMVGPGSFWCNSPPLSGYDGLSRRFVVMGFSYERGIGEMLESYGHRAESILHHVYRDRHYEANLWKRFCRTDRSHPGQAEVGTIHFAPNSHRDYEWGSREEVPSRCDNWHSFPKLDGPPRLVDCSEWGDGDIRKHHLWWFNHLPHVAGEFEGLSQNWWEYIIDPNRIKQ